MKELNEELTRAVKSIIEKVREEDKTVRYRQVRNYKKLKYYFDGITCLYGGTNTAHDWQVWDSQFLYGGNADSGDEVFYDKNINVFKALIETIISALSVTTPSVIAFPDDANNVEDLATAKAAASIFKLVKRHNDISLLWIHALFIYVTEGMVWAYNYTDEDEKYGSYETNEYEDVEEEVDQKVCSICKTNLVEDAYTDSLEDQYNPQEPDVPMQDVLQNGVLCPQCNMMVNPELAKQKIVVQKLVGKTSHPKSRECIEVYGGLNVKISTYARSMDDVTYLQLSDEINIWKAMHMFPDLRQSFWKNGKLQPGGPQLIDSWMRASTQYLGITPENICTRERTWLKVESYQYLADDDQVKELTKMFPFGLKATMINDEIVEVEADKLEDHWTPTVNPNSNFLQFDPLGNTIVSIQDIIRDLTSLTLQTIEHGIPQTFINPSVVDLDAYGQTETKPGMIFPAKSASGRPLQDDILTLKTAQLGGEVLPFAEKTMEMGQMTSGALPSLYGGDTSNSSGTATQYTQSRNNALQRLKTVWTVSSYWWKNTFGKVIPAYMKCIEESGDERFVIKNESGDFINVEIRRSELFGKIGSIELESSEELPSTPGQVKEMVMQLLQSPNQVIFQAITDPRNLPVLQRAIGLEDFHLPGSDDREKQLEEIRLLLQAEPMTAPNGMQLPSVAIDELVDNHELEAEVCKSFLKSDEGRLAKIENPEGYKNVLLHMANHKDAAMRMMMISQQSMMGPAEKAGELKNEVDKVPSQKPAIAKGTPDERSESPVTVN